MTASPILSFGTWRNNAELILDVHRLGYVTDDHRVLDPTYGLGRFWTLWRPHYLTASDLDPTKSPVGIPVDFTAMPWPDGRYDVVTLDPPYKLNGTSTGKGSSVSDADYGVDRWASWQDRHKLICDGITESIRVLAGDGCLLLKCQDQVCGGKVRWQTREFADHAEALGCRLVDRLDMPSYRAQPAGRRQVHARRNTSTLLVFQKKRPATATAIGRAFGVDTAPISTLTPGS